MARYWTISTLVTAVRNGPGGKSIIFAPTIRIGQEISKGLGKVGLDVPFFHAKLRPKDRDNLQARFDGRIEPKLDVMISTSAFGMGIDIPDIRLVIHWQHPASIEDYLQEFGRASRDGGSSLAVLFQGKNDGRLHEWMLTKSLQNTRVAPSEIDRIKRDRRSAIRELNKIVKNKAGCFCKAIRHAFGDDPKSRRALSIRLLEWVFTGSRRRRRVTDCCDACAGHPDDRVAWGKKVISKM